MFFAIVDKTALHPRESVLIFDERVLYDLYRITSLERFNDKFRDRIGQAYVIGTKNYHRKEGIVYIPAYMTICLQGCLNICVGVVVKISTCQLCERIL